MANYMDGIESIEGGEGRKTAIKYNPYESQCVFRSQLVEVQFKAGAPVKVPFPADNYLDNQFIQKIQVVQSREAVANEQVGFRMLSPMSGKELLSFSEMDSMFITLRKGGDARIERMPLNELFSGDMVKTANPALAIGANIGMVTRETLLFAPFRFDTSKSFIEMTRPLVSDGVVLLNFFYVPVSTMAELQKQIQLTAE